MNLNRRLMIDRGGPGHRGPSLPACDVPVRPLAELLPGVQLRASLELPQVTEPEVVRHFIELSSLNHHIDKGLYPLGSCTMKHNPKINDELAALPGFALAHPLAGDDANQGSLRVMRELQKALAEITGFAAVTTQPVAGAHVEMTGLMLIRAWHRSRGEGEKRLIFQDEVLTGGSVGVRLSGPVDIRPVISQGCRLIGDRFVVTRAEHNLIYELGGVPALERLQAVFESLPGEDRRHAHRALHLGIVIDEHRDRFERGDFLVRNLVGADQTDGSVAVGDVVQEGQTVQFQLRDAKSASEDLNLLLAADRAAHRRQPLGALMFSCCGRGRGLFGKPNHDAETMAEQLGSIPLAGFFAQGEIGPVGGRNFLHGYTACMALFAEQDSSKITML